MDSIKNHIGKFMSLILVFLTIYLYHGEYPWYSILLTLIISMFAFKYDHYRRKVIQLEERLSLFNSITNSMPDLIKIKDRHGNWLYANTSLLETFNLNPYNYKGKTNSKQAFSDMHMKNMLSRLEETDELTWKLGSPLNYEDVIEGQDNKPNLHLDIIKVPQFDKDGQRKSLAFIARDITQRKQTESALHEADNKYRSLVEGALAGVFLFQNGVIVYANPKFKTIFGTEDINTPSIINTLLNKLILINSDGSNIEFEYDLNQVKLYLEGHVTATIYMGKSAYIGVVTDITMRKENEKTLHRLATILEETSDFVSIADADRKICYYNQAAMAMLGISPDDDLCSYEIGNNYPQWAKKIIFDEALPTATVDGVWKGETTLITRSGREIPVLQAILAHKNQHGEVEFYSTIAADISLKQAKDKMRLSKLLLKRTLEVQEEERKVLAQELHDGVSQSLYSILLGLQALEIQVCGHSPHLSYIQQMINELDRLIKEVKTYSQQLRPTIIDEFGLVSSIEQIIETLSQRQHQPQVHFKTNLEREQRYNIAIEIHLYRILQEALQNALKYAKAEDIQINLSTSQSSLQLTIGDNGIGFDRNIVKNGLGIKHIEERASFLKGNLKIRTSKDKGTVISVKIPIDEDSEND